MSNQIKFIVKNRFMKSNVYTPELRNIMMKLYGSVTASSKPHNSN